MLKAAFILFLIFFSNLIFCQTDSNGGFEKIPYMEQESSQGMILIEGTRLAGLDEKKLKAKVYPFFISAYEESNAQYCTYLLWLKKWYSENTYRQALPDTNVWRKENFADSVKEYLVKNYLRGCQFRNYPVVGLNAEQIRKYAIWKTDRLNEFILVTEGIISEKYNPKDSTEIYCTESYLAGTWKYPGTQMLPSFDEKSPERNIRMEDAILSPPYRLPTPNEWKLAALAIGDNKNRYIKTKKFYSPKKYDKKKNFTYLFPEELKREKCNEKKNMQMPAGFVEDVFSGTVNNYLIHGMYNKLSEMVCDTTGQLLSFGTFPDDERDLAPAVFSPDSKDSVKYIIPSVPQGKKLMTNYVSAALGFRLALSHFGPIDPSYQQKERQKGMKIFISKK